MSTTYSINGRTVSERQYLQRVLPVVFAERDALRRQVEAVRALHHREADIYIGRGPHCDCGQPWPCATVQALDGAE